MKILIVIFLILKCAAYAETSVIKLNQLNNAPNRVTKEELVIDADSFFDPKADYSNFSGRVTDRDQTASIVKISSENKNVKYFRASDLIEFKVQNNPKSDYCQGHVRSIEDSYFVIYVKDLGPCFNGEEYFRRGTALLIHSEKLAMRIREASVYRATLIKKKKDYMEQLNNLNQQVFTYEEKKVEVASDYDRKITELESQKIKDLDKLLSEKNDQVRLQRELAYRLDSIDKELNFYRLEKQELLFDRWHLDHDLGYPVYKRPEEVRDERASSNF